MNTTDVKNQPSCADNFEVDSLSVDEARRRIQAVIAPAKGFEKVAIRSAMGRILLEDVISNIDVPSHTNAAMDGYALAGTDLPGRGVTSLRVIGTAWAGQPYTARSGPGECVRIMTGAKMPDGTDTVIMQEQAEHEDDVVRIGTGHRAGQNVREAGEDLAAGEIALHAGKKLAPAELGLLASLGIGEIKVTRRLRVAFFSTGDELRSIGETLKDGEVYDSNRYTLYGMLERLGADLLDMGVVPDRRDALRQAFEHAARNADVVITTGGVSVGEADFVKEILAELGTVDFWKIAIKPGRPLAFGRVLDSVFFGLPGNPVAVMVTFYQFVQPALRHMMGEDHIHPARIRAVAGSKLKKKPGRTEFVRAHLHADDKGQMVAVKTGFQGSGILSSMSRANCFVVLPPECTGVEAGELVEVQLFEGLV